MSDHSPPSDLFILIVDDARFSATIISRALKAGGYQHLAHVSSASEALEFISKQPVGMIIADWMMPEMDGLELTQKIRQMDEASNHYTYVIMLTARDGIEAMKHAFEEGVDDFVNKSVMQQQLLPRIFAAERLLNNQNRLLRDAQKLLEENQQLQKANHALKNLSTLDALTGFGNTIYNRNKLSDNLRYSESRGGATCYMLLRINGLTELEAHYPARIINELIVGVSRRLKNLVRPLDDLSRLNKSTFAIITHQSDLNLCIGASFKRIADAINHRAFQTSAGFKEITVTMALAAADNKRGLPSLDDMMQLAERALAQSTQTQRIEHIHYQKTQ